MRLRTTLQLASFVPIFLAALLVVYVFSVEFSADADSAARAALPKTTAVFVAVLALLMGFAFYRLGRNLIRNIGAMETMARRVREGDLTPAAPLPGMKGHVSTVTEVFSEMIVELRGYVELIGAHEKLKKEIDAAHSTVQRLRDAAVPASSALELLRRAEHGILSLLLEDDLFLLGWLPPDALRGMLEGSGSASGQAAVASMPAGLESLLPGRPAAPVEGSTGESIQEESVKEALETAIRLCRWKWDREQGKTSPDVSMDVNSTATFRVRGERAGLTRVFLPVLQNAAEAMPRGGSISVELGGDDSGKINVSITDRGDGMSDAVRTRCMRPFFSTKEGRLGIGLTLAARLATSWGGRIGVISEPGQGTTVHMTFSPTAPAVQPMAPQNLDPLRILLVEDDAATRETLLTLLRRDKHRVTAVEDGAAAIKSLGEKQFDVVITDRAMPVISGDELALAVKESNPTTAVVMITGMGDAMERLDQHPASVDVVLAKPVGLNDLRTGLAQALERAEPKE